MFIMKYKTVQAKSVSIAGTEYCVEFLRIVKTFWLGCGMEAVVQHGSPRLLKEMQTQFRLGWRRCKVTFRLG